MFNQKYEVLPETKSGFKEKYSHQSVIAHYNDNILRAADDNQ